MGMIVAEVGEVMAAANAKMRELAEGIKAPVKPADHQQKQTLCLSALGGLQK